MNEIAADSACLVDPGDISSIERGVKKLISDDYYRDSLVTNGIVNIERFRVVNIARSYTNLYAGIPRKRSGILHF